MDELLDGEGRLDAVLASVGAHLVHPEPSGWDGPRARRVRWAPLAVVAAVLVLLVLTALVVAPVRRAVAGWLGIGSTRVEQVGSREADPSGLPTLRDGVTVITAEDAAVALGRPLPASFPVLGAPQELARAREGGVLLGWAVGRTTLWVRVSDVEGMPLVKKLLGSATGVRFVEGLGDAALLVDAPHVLETPDRRLAAGRVVLWVADGREFRLESDLPADRLLAVARGAAAAFAP